MRRGVTVLVLGVLAAALGVVSARAADGTTTGTTTTTGTGTTTPAPSYAPLAASSLRGRCVGAGTAAIIPPGRPTLLVGSPASARGPSAYPANVPFLSFDSSTASGSTCRTAHVALESLSLFGGAVTASSVAATDGKGTVSDLQIDGASVSLTAGQTTAVGLWGRVTLGSTTGRFTAPLVVTLLRRHYSLPPGTTIAIAFAASAVPADKPSATQQSSGSSTKTNADGTVTNPRHRHRKHHKSQPLKVTPPLGFRPSHYVFPVNGGASYVDTYGAERSDVSGGWHHGDDLFAPLGTPVVAVATGKLSLVGWEQIGGWRLWLTDAMGNSFYYAHLAGYSSWILHHSRVHAGEVLGFLGRTGDAFTTTPHLHFEIHPHETINLGYDGAVDPTAYLQKWRVVKVPAKDIPLPAKMKAPRGTPTEEASVVWHQLLVARHLLHVSGNTSAPVAGTPRRPFPASPVVITAGGKPPVRIGAISATAGRVRASRSTAPWVGGGVAGLLALLSAGAFTFRRCRRGADETPS
jgi:murein DD-endopeptidase MepM/ murein hydrolase activator NlpD